MTPLTVPSPGRVAVTGANGFVGARLVPHLAGRGAVVHAVVRGAPTVEARRGVEVHVADVADVAVTTTALSGCEVAYYLVHAMAGGSGFAARDRALARSFARAASAAGVGRIVYLGGLGQGHLSEHLASRQEVGRVLGSTGVPVVELRAAVVLGAGSISFEMVRYLTERLPVMVCPRWVSTATQPVALGDLLAYLTEASGVAPGVYEVGCPDATTYREMMETYARVRGLRRRLIMKVPVLTPTLSAHWVDLVTPVDRAVSHALIGSLTNEVTVRDRARTDAAFTVRPWGSRRPSPPPWRNRPPRSRRRCSTAARGSTRASTPIDPRPGSGPGGPRTAPCPGSTRTSTTAVGGSPGTGCRGPGACGSRSVTSSGRTSGSAGPSASSRAPPSTGGPSNAVHPNCSC